MFIRQGLYKKGAEPSTNLAHVSLGPRVSAHTFAHTGVFKFVLSIPEAYPNAAPTLRFVTPVFHPLVSAQGELRCLLCFTAAHTAHTVDVLTSCAHTHT